jgi:predicted glycosyltransferase
MKILIDIGHPGHVHLFRPFAEEMIEKGNEILFTCRQKEFEVELLEAANFKFISFGKHFKSKVGKIWGLFKFDLKMIFISFRFKPDIFFSHGSIYAAHASFFINKPHISMDDSGNMEQIKLYLPFTKAVLTPNELPQKLGKKQIRYHSYHEVAYLSPKYFTPNKKIIESLDVLPDEEYALIRFVSWNATHDIGQGGLRMVSKEKIVDFLSSKMKVFISSEGEVPEKFRKYLIKIKPEEMHHVLAFASIVVSEGATMASEAGVLGTPAVYVNSLARCYNEDQEKYGTVFNFRNENGVVDKIYELVNSKLNMVERRKKLLSDKIDTTAFLIWFIENWPNSFKTMKEKPDYQYNFK